MPSDVLANSERYEGELIHWVGIVDTFSVWTNGDSVFTEIRFEQHYYDYIEDFSIQTETMFVSPLGGGDFLYGHELAGVPADSVRQMLSVTAKPGDLGFAYGTFREIRNGLPYLDAVRVRFIPEKYFSTAIFKYDVQRDADGEVVADKRGFPVLTGLEILKLAGPGEND